MHDNNSSTPLSVDPTSGNLTGMPGDLIARYGYDALGRRIAKHVLIEEDPPPPTPNYAQHYFYYDGHRLIEHHKEDAQSALSLHRQYVYGLEYIDEVVAYYDEVDALHFVFQDAGYNVVGVTNSTGVLEQQYTYTPYGQRLTAQSISGSTVSPIDITTSLDGLALTLGYKGLRQEDEIGFWYSRNRDLDSILGRFRQKDPNETGLLVASVLRQNAQTALAMASVSPGVQYGDGMGPYEFVGSNPITGRDPSGLFADIWDEVDDIAAHYYADRVAAGIETIDRAREMVAGAAARLKAMLARMAVEAAAVAIRPELLYGFVAMDMADAFLYMYEEGLTWGAVGGLAAQYYGLKSAAGLHASLGIKPRRGVKRSAGTGLDVTPGRFNWHLRKGQANYRNNIVAQASTRTLERARQSAVRKAWRQERRMVRKTGEGTVKWTKAQKNELLATGKVKGYEGHHINSVNGNPHLAGNPANVRFVKSRRGHLLEHGGNWRNPTSGPLLDRSVP